MKYWEMGEDIALADGFCENSSRSSFSPRLGTVKVTPSKSIVADGRKGTITSRASRDRQAYHGENSQN